MQLGINGSKGTYLFPVSTQIREKQQYYVIILDECSSEIKFLLIFIKYYRNLFHVIKKNNTKLKTAV